MEHTPRPEHPNEVDEIAVADRFKKNDHLTENLDQRRRGKTAPWLDFDAEARKGVFKNRPAREDIVVPVNELQVIEYYSR